MALGVKQKVTSVCDILSFAYSGVESVEAPPLPRKSYRLQTRRVCCSSWVLGRLKIFIATDNVAHVRPSIASCDVVLPSQEEREKASSVVESGEIKLIGQAFAGHKPSAIRPP